MSIMYRIVKNFPRSRMFPLELSLLNKEKHCAHLRKFDRTIYIASKLCTKRDTGIHRLIKYQTSKGVQISPGAINIRHCREDDIKSFIQLTRKEGWDNTEFDCHAALKLDPSSIIVAADDFDNPVGFMGVHDMFNDTLYVGQFLVKENDRGRGIGRKLVAAAWDRIGCTNICIDAADNLVEYYGNQGIVHEAFRSIAHKGIVTSVCKRFKANSNECDIVLLTEDIWPDLLNYDRTIYRGISREKILRLWFVGECVHTVVAFCKGKVSGYGSLVKAGDDYFIKTVFGDNANVVDEIIDNMLDQIPIGAMLTFVSLADKNISERFTGFEPTIVTHRLSNKFAIETESDKMFYICYQFV